MDLVDEQECMDSFMVDLLPLRSSAYEAGNSCRYSKVFKNLTRFDFTPHIGTLCSKFFEGTRKWVLDQVYAWFNDTSCENCAFVIRGEPGMGKSVIAAVVSHEMAAQLAGSHFFQYDNTRYNNTCLFLQSLALQMCDVIPGFKQALTNHVFENFKYDFNEKSAEDLFTLLLAETFAEMSDPSSGIFLIVIDGIYDIESSSQKEFVDLISNHFHKFPNFIRFLITTSSEEEFENLNPLYLQIDGEKSRKDMKIFIESQLPQSLVNKELVVPQMVDLSGDLMLNAHFLCEIILSQCESEKYILPKTSENIFQQYFAMLENKWEKITNFSKETFVSLLSVIVVAREPLPIALVQTAVLDKFDVPPCNLNSILLKALNYMSSLFIVNDDHISFVHKSVKDWLLHHYNVDFQYGHKILAKVCVEYLDNVKNFRTMKKSLFRTAEVGFALRHCVYHILQEWDKYINFVNTYAVDLYVLYASICVNIDTAIKNFDIILNHEEYESLGDQTKENLSQLLQLLVTFQFVLRKRPHSFFQLALNETTQDLSSNASKLLKSFEKFQYFEIVRHGPEPIQEYFECSALPYTSIDVSYQNNNVVFCLKVSDQIYVIQLVSTNPYKILWTTKKLSYDQICSSCIAFHPSINVILPGRLDQVVSLTDGSWQQGPFSCEEKCFFTNCCFSSDATMMVTTYDDSSLVVWDLVNGVKVKNIECPSVPSSFLFSASDNFLAAVDTSSILVHDVKNDYMIKEKISLQTLRFRDYAKIVCTLRSDAWLLETDNSDIYVVYSGGSTSRGHPLVNMKELYLPHNSKALTECNEVINFDYKTSWITEARKGCVKKEGGNVSLDRCKFILLDDNNALAISNSTEESQSTCLLRIDLSKFKTVKSYTSHNSSIIYQHDPKSRKFRILRFWNGEWQFVEEFVKPVITFTVVLSGVFLVTSGTELEFWNTDCSNCLKSFPQSSKIDRCETVSNHTIACITEGEVNFIDSLNEEIVSTTSLSPNEEVLACNSQYDVVVSEEPSWSTEVFLVRNNERVGTFDVCFDVFKAVYSPNARMLVVASVGGDISIIDNFNYYSWVSSFTLILSNGIHFVNDRYFVYVERRKKVKKRYSLYLCDNFEIVACFSLKDEPKAISMNPEIQTLVVSFAASRFTEFRIHLPDQKR